MVNSERSDAVLGGHGGQGSSKAARRAVSGTSQPDHDREPLSVREIWQQSFEQCRYLSRTQIREIFGISESQLNRLVKESDWPRGVWIGQRKKYLVSEVQGWLESHTE